MCRHPIFDRPQDLDVTVGTLGDYPCLCSFGVPGVLGSRTVPQDLRTRPFVFGFAPNTCVLPWKGMECFVRHPYTPPAGARGHRLAIVAIGTILCRSALNFVKMTLFAGRTLCTCFLRYFQTAVCNLLPLHTRVWRDEPLVA